MSTSEQLLRKLDERFILGEISQEQYQQMRQRLVADASEESADGSPSHAGGMEIADSVIKGNVTSGSASVGNININVGQGPAGGSSAELEYEKCVMLTLRSGGSLESIRRELDDRRLAIGLPIRLAREIEEACLESCGRRPIHGRAVSPQTAHAGPDPLTRFFKSASESIASMFANSRPMPLGPQSIRPTPIPPVNPPMRSGGGPPPVPWLAKPPAAKTEVAAAVKEALKEELRAGLRAELAAAVEKKDEDTAEGDKPEKAGEEPQTMRKPPPLPAMPPPLRWPGKDTPKK